MTVAELRALVEAYEPPQGVEVVRRNEWTGDDGQPVEEQGPWEVRLRTKPFRGWGAIDVEPDHTAELTIKRLDLLAQELLEDP